MKPGSAIFHESRHMAESQLLPPYSACHFCGSENRLSICVLQKAPVVSLLKCDNCGAASASRIPTKEALGLYYDGYYTSPCFDAHAQRSTFDDTKRFGLHLAQRLVNYPHRSSIKIVDFGGGDGAVALRTAEQLLQRGFVSADIMVVDYNKTLAKTGDTCISLARKDTLDDLSFQTYDFVIASAVIEHLPKPMGTLITLLNLLNRGGVFYARTPCVVPFMNLLKLLGLEWNFAFPAHIHDLGQDFWEAFFGKIISPAHFSLLESRPSVVETSFKDHFLRTMAAFTLKAPWYLLGKHYALVGGWEIFVRKESDAIMGAEVGS